MELVERKEETLTEVQKEDLFNSIIRGKDCVETIKTSRGEFKVKYPRVKDIEAIGRLTAMRLNGLAAQSFDPYMYSLIQQRATLDIIVTEGPAWYENAKKENLNFTWGDIPDQNFIGEVYALAYDFREKITKYFNRNQEETDTRMATSVNNDTVTQSNLFDGLSSK